MGRLFKLRNLSPAPSVEQLAVMVAQYEMMYGDTYDQKDNLIGEDLWGELYGEALLLVANDPKGLLTRVTSEIMEYRDDPIDRGQMDVLGRLQDSIKAFIAVRGD